MDSNFTLNLPLNSLSFGQCSIAILREIYKRNLQPCLFPIGGGVDLSAQSNLSQDFVNWLNSCIGKSLKTHKKTTPTIKLWHLNGSLESLSNKQILLTFFELDQITSEEKNIIDNQSLVFVTSNYTKRIFEDYGCNNVKYVPLGFDSDNFQVLNKIYFTDGRISFGLYGKYEKRKHTEKIIKAWIKKYGNNPKFYLNIAIFNQFLKPEDNQNIINKIMAEASGGNRIWNTQFFGFLPQNAAYNDMLNSNDVVIGMSGGEGFGLPEFQSLCLGKHGVILNAHSYKDWATNENAVLVQPDSKIDSADGMFFHKGAPFNQGNIFSWSDDAFIDGCEKAIQRVVKSRINNEGLKLQQEFNWNKTVDIILKELENI